MNLEIPMKRFTITMVPALLATCMLVGCQPAAEKTPDTTTTTTSTTGGGMDKPSMDSLASMDFSSPEKIQSTVIPALKGLLAANPQLAGAKLDVVLKDKILHVNGEVQNNDQKRAIDEVVKPLTEKAKAAGINILNGAIVKG